MKKQGSDDRLDESLGMRRGKESGKSQSYKGRRDESRGASKSNERYMPKSMGGKVMGHDKMPKNIEVPECQGWSEVKPYKQGSRGYPSQAFDYKY